MMSWLIGGLLIVTGLVAAGVGIAVARHGFHAAQRMYFRMAARSTMSPEDWDAWFLGGFSGVSLGFRGLVALVVWLVWTLAGLGVIGLGVRLFGHS